MTYELHCADFREALADTDAEFRAIITDPPYAGRHLHLTASLVSMSSRALRSGGHLVILSGMVNFAAICALIESHDLKYRWVFAHLLRGAHPANLGLHIFNWWKPIIWASKGTLRYKERERDGYICDRLLDDMPKGKSIDPWAQGRDVADYMLDIADVRPGDTVLDPMMGMGYVVEAAHRRGAHGIGYDYQQELVDKTKDWLASLDEGGA